MDNYFILAQIMDNYVVHNFVSMILVSINDKITLESMLYRC